MMMLHLLPLLLLSVPALANDSDVDLTKKYESAVVKIQVLQQGIPIELGAGFFVNGEGVIVTNKHVAGPGIFNNQLTLQVLTKSGEKFQDVKVLRCGSDQKELDLCVLKIPYKSPHFIQVERIAPDKGDDVLVIGHPRGLEYSLSTGIVSSVRDMPAPLASAQTGKIPTVETVQVTAPISPGNSGGPIFNRHGKLLGVSTWIRIDAGSENLNFGVSANEVMDYLHLDEKPQELHAFQEKVANAKRKLAKELAAAVNGPVFKALDSGAELKGLPMAFHEETVALGSRRVSVQFPSQPGAAYECKKSPDGDGVSCGIPGSGGVRLTANLFPAKAEQVKGFNGTAVSNPEPLPIISDDVKSGRWEAMKKTLSPKQQKYLFSVPSNYKCKQEKSSSRDFWNHAWSCTGGVYNVTAADVSSFLYVSQIDGDDFALITSVMAPDPYLTGFLYDWPVIMAGSAKVLSRSAKGAPASSVAAATPTAEPSAPPANATAEEVAQFSATKARMTEAKIALARLYAAEKALYAEFGAYATDTVALGVTDVHPVHYACGFRKAGPLKAPEGVQNYDANRNFVPGGGMKVEDLPESSGVTTTGFVAACAGRPGKSGALDVWTIDESKHLVHAQMGY